MSFTNSHSIQPSARLLPDREQLVSGPSDDLGLLCVPGDSSTLEANHGYDQIEAWFALVQTGLQPNFPPPHDASTTELYDYTQPGGMWDHFTSQSLTEDQRSRDRTTDRGARPTCGYCSKDFGRLQEFERHVEGVHMPWHRCPFCDFMWTRPCRIKTHIVTHHAETFTPEMLEEIKSLRGRHVIKFLDAYNYVPDVGVTPGSLIPSQL